MGRFSPSPLMWVLGNELTKPEWQVLLPAELSHGPVGRTFNRGWCAASRHGERGKEEGAAMV